MEMDKPGLEVILSPMSKDLKASINTSVFIALAVAFFLYANEFKTDTKMADAGENDYIENPLDEFLESLQADYHAAKITEIKKEEKATIPEQAEQFTYNKTIYAKVTAYTPGEESCGKFADGFTSTGTNAWVINGVAAAPKVIPYGSWVHIPEVGYREVDDTGGAMKTSWKKDKVFHVDLRFQSVKQAREWGVRWLPVHIYKKKQE